MCPDRQIISLYFDGELPSPWKEKLLVHLESCAKCQTVLAGYNYIGDSLKPFPAEIIQTAQDTIWKKLTSPELVMREQKITNRQYKPDQRVWKRNVSLPLPAAAAAAVLIVVLGFALIGLKAGPKPTVAQNSVAAANIGFDEQGIVPIKDTSGVLNYLSSQDNSDFVVVRLPGSKNFSRSGEPTLINAADYSRRRISQ